MSLLLLNPRRTTKMLTKLLILVIILIQLVTLFGLWLHTGYINERLAENRQIEKTQNFWLYLARIWKR